MRSVNHVDLPVIFRRRLVRGSLRPRLNNNEQESKDKYMTISTMSQKSARDGLGTPSNFEGGVYVTRNGVAELFVQTAAEREIEMNELRMERQTNALLRLVMLAKQDIKENRKMSPEEALRRMRDARK